MKKPLIIALIIHITIVFCFCILFFFLSDKKITHYNNVMIIKDAEIIENYFDNYQNPNTEKIVSSGFFIDPKTIVTVAHGVNKNNSDYKIIDIFGKEYKGKLLLKDDEKDIGIIEIFGEYTNYNKIKIADDIEIGDKVFLINYKNEIKTGEILKIIGDNIISNIQFSDGDSGSILVNSKNELIGINKEFDINNGLGISIKYSF